MFSSYILVNDIPLECGFINGELFVTYKGLSAVTGKQKFIRQKHVHYRKAIKLLEQFGVFATINDAIEYQETKRTKYDFAALFSLKHLDRYDFIISKVLDPVQMIEMVETNYGPEAIFDKTLCGFRVRCIRVSKEAYCLKEDLMGFKRHLRVERYRIKAFVYSGPLGPRKKFLPLDKFEKQYNVKFEDLVEAKELETDPEIEYSSDEFEDIKDDEETIEPMEPKVHGTIRIPSFINIEPSVTFLRYIKGYSIRCWTQEGRMVCSSEDLFHFRNCLGIYEHFNSFVADVEEIEKKYNVKFEDLRKKPVRDNYVDLTLDEAELRFK